jgi:hypothetical protein
MSDHLDLPFHGDDIDIYRVRTSGFVLTAYRYTPDGKDEESYSAEAAGDLAPHCVKHLVENATEDASWQLALAVYGEEQVPAGFIADVMTSVAAQVATWWQAQRESDAAKAPASEVRRCSVSMTDDEMADWIRAEMEQSLTESFSRDPIPYSAEGMTLISQAFDRAEASLTDEQRAWLRNRADAMTPEDWDAFAAAAIRTVGVDDLLANAAPDGDAP